MPKPIYTKERRDANMQLVVDQLDGLKELDFNSIIFTFADIIQSTFMNGLFIGTSKEQREALNEEIIEHRNAVIDTLNKQSKNMMMDMIVLSDLLMDAVENAGQNALEDAKKA